MEREINLKLKNGEPRKLLVVEHKTDKKLIFLRKLDSTRPHYLKIGHSVLNTHLECSDMNESILLYLKEDGSIAGASFISPSNQGTFGIVTQAKYIFFVPALFKIDVNSIQSIQIIP